MDSVVKMQHQSTNLAAARFSINTTVCMLVLAQTAFSFAGKAEQAQQAPAESFEQNQ